MPLAGYQPVADRDSCVLDPSFPYGEDMLQFIWEAQLFDRKALHTTDGRTLEVIHPGTIQHNSGPDLEGAHVRIGGQEWRGTVEVHLRSSEWNTHGHQDDPAYGNVVLHVVHEHDREVSALGGLHIPTVELGGRINVGQAARIHGQGRGRYGPPCAHHIPELPTAAMDRWLFKLAIKRLERRSKEVERIYRISGNDVARTIHHMLFRAFGSNVNATPFEMLAHAVPAGLIWKYREDALRMEALLFGQAGLLQVDRVDTYPRSLRREYTVMARSHGLRHMPLAAWKFGRMRPLSFPTVRIAQLAGFLRRCNGSYAHLLGPTELTEIRGSLNADTGNYWNTHYVFDRSSAPRIKRLGRQGVDRIVINAVIPTLYSMGRLLGRVDLIRRALSLLEQLPAETNKVVKDWSHHGLVARSALDSQALLELKEYYCSPHRCLSCAIGKDLLKRSQ